MDATDFSFSKNMLIKHEHPSLKGHFPDNPIVPGVVILDQVMRLWQQKSKKQILQINNTKFVQLLRADINCTIEYKEVEYKEVQYKEKSTKKINFLIRDDSQTIIAKGLFSYD